MSKPKVTTLQAARCLKILEDADAPVVAVDLAARLGLSGCRESRRRCVRAVIEHLRKNGSMVIATQRDGYRLTHDPKEYRAYLEARQIDDKHDLGVTHRQKKMLADSKGQGFLFGQRIYCGCASVGIG